MMPTIPPGNSVEEVCETPHPSLRGASRSLSAAFRGCRDVAVASSMPSSSSSSDTCIVVVDNGNDRRRRCSPAEERAVELAEAIHRDNGKGKREKKERRGGSVGVGDNDDAPALRSDDGTILDSAAWVRARTAATPRRTGAATATTGPPMTAGVEKNAMTEVRFPQWLSICWTPPITRTGAD